jgi:hypothetical protein
MWQAAVVAERIDAALLDRVRAVLADEPLTETELRTLTEQVDALVRVIAAQIQASEAHLSALADEPASSLTVIADELQRVETLRPRLAEARSLVADLEARAREVRTAWLLRQANGTVAG